MPYIGCHRRKTKNGDRSAGRQKSVIRVCGFYEL
jgi:hypothetical protein